MYSLYYTFHISIIYITKTLSPQKLYNGLVKASLTMVRNLGTFDRSAIHTMLDEIDCDFNNEQTAACKNDRAENISHTPCSSLVKKKMNMRFVIFKTHLVLMNYLFLKTNVNDL